MTKEKKRANWFLEAVKPTTTEKLMLTAMANVLRVMVDEKVKKGLKVSDALIESAKSLLGRKK